MQMMNSWMNEDREDGKQGRRELQSYLAADGRSNVEISERLRGWTSG